VAYEIELQFEQMRSDSLRQRSQLAVEAVILTMPVEDDAPKLTLKQAIDSFMADPTRSRTTKSEAVYRTTYATIAAIMGEDAALAQINREACRELLSVLQHLPSNARKRLPSMSPREAAAYAETNGMASMSVANINEYMNKLATLFNWAVKEEMMPRNPANGLRLANPVANRDRRNPFAPQQLTKIFNAPLYRGLLIATEM
jgi:hypothetical protein